MVPISAFTSLINIIYLLTSKVKILFCCQFTGSSSSGGLDAEEFSCNAAECNAGDLGMIPELGKYPVERYGNPLQYSCLKKPRGQESLAGYCPRGHKESNTTK